MVELGSRATREASKGDVTSALGDGVERERPGAGSENSDISVRGLGGEECSAVEARGHLGVWR